MPNTRGCRGSGLEKKLQKACEELAAGTGKIESLVKKIERLEALIEKKKSACTPALFKPEANTPTQQTTACDSTWVVKGY